MLMVETSDIDQLVLGYVAEERYIQTRNQLFRESPNLPEKVPILSIFGDISSENRLQKILQEYVQLKTGQLTPLCAVCDQCDNLSDVWKAFDRIVQKIRNYKPPEPQQPSPTTTMPELQRYSPSHIWQGIRKGKLGETGNNLDVAETLHRKKLNPLSSEYDTVSIENHKSIGGSGRRKKFSVPKRIQNPVSEIIEPYAHNGDLSMLLHTSDKNDALALVGVKILSNMKKCAEKGSSGSLNTPCKVNSAATSLPEPSVPLSPRKCSYGALDIDDLVSDETRGDLVEMTIDSILNPDISGPSQNALVSKNCSDGDFSELRKLLEFGDTSSACLTIPDLIQFHQDERDLIEIIKSDDSLDLPDNPAPMLYEADQGTLEQSTAEKNAVAGLSAIRSSSNDAPPMVEEEVNKTQNICTTPIILKVRSERDVGDVVSSPTRDNCPDNTENVENSMVLLETNVVPEIQGRSAAEILDSCSTMPPKKRFLAQGTRTPKKCSDENLTTFTSPHTKGVQIAGNLTDLNSPLSPTRKESTLTDIISTAATLSNLELPFSQVDDLSLPNQQIVTLLSEPNLARTTIAASISSAGEIEVHPSRTDSNNESDLTVTSAKSATQQSSQVRRSKRPHNPNLALSDLVRKPRAPSKGKNSRAVTSTPNISRTDNMPKSTSSLSTVKVLKPGQGSVVISLKDRGRMPVLVSGIIVQSKNEENISKEDIITQLVNQVQKEARNTSTVDESKKNAQNSVSVPRIQIAQTDSQSLERDTTPERHLMAAPKSHDQQPLVSEVNDVELVLSPNVSQSQILGSQLHDSQLDVSETALPDPTMDLLRTCGTDAPQTQIPLTLPSTAADQEMGVVGSFDTPILEDSLMASLDIAFMSRGEPVSGENSKTPSKTHQQRQFSTISPGDIFSVTNRPISPVNPSQLASVKSNLLTAFLEKERVEGINPNDADNAIRNKSSSQTSNLQYTELRDVSATHASSNTLDLNDTIPATSTPTSSFSAPCVTSRLTGGSKTMKSVPSVMKRKIAKPKPDLGKCVLLQKRSRSGILMCSKMKNMVRIEPKQLGVTAVKRYVVQAGKGGAEEPIMDVNRSMVQNRPGSGSVTTRLSKCLVLEYLDDQTSRRIAAEEMGRVQSKKCEENSSSSSGKHVPNSEDTAKTQNQINTETEATANKRPETNSTPKKRKKNDRRKSPEKKKRLKLSNSGGPVMKWTYNEIHSKLDFIHGKNKSENDKGTEISTQIRNEQTEKGVVSEEYQEEEASLRIMSNDETHCKGGVDCSVTCKEKDSVVEKDFDSTVHRMTVVEQTHPDCLVTHENVQKNDDVMNVQSENPELSFRLPVSLFGFPESSAKRRVEKSTSGGDPVLNIPDESQWLPFDVQQIEPLDLSLSSWLCNSKSPFKNVPNFAASMQLGSVQTVTKVYDAQRADAPNRKPLEEVSCKNSQHRKRSGKKKSAKRFQRLEEKIKKVDLKNMDISKFLDSLKYNET